MSFDIKINWYLLSFFTLLLCIDIVMLDIMGIIIDVGLGVWCIAELQNSYDEFSKDLSKNTITA